VETKLYATICFSVYKCFFLSLSFHLSPKIRPFFFPVKALSILSSGQYDACWLKPSLSAMTSSSLLLL
jgi:hypothetical protein